MGFKKIAKGVAKVAASPVVAAHRAVLGGKKGGGGEQGFQIDPAIEAGQQKLVQEAKDFRAKMPGLQKEQETIARDQSRNQLAQMNADTKTGFNQRGLLFSGLKTGAESDNQGRAAADLSGRVAQSNAQLENMASSMEQSAIESGRNAANLTGQAAGQALEMQLAAMKARSAGMASGMGALGTGIGMALGSKEKS